MSYDFKSLDKIATGEVSVTVASKLIKTTMEELTESKVQKLYTVLRAWVWKALNERRRDSELRRWHALISQTSAYLEDDYSCHAERIRVLHELVHESISVSIVYSFPELAQRSHVKEILSYLYVSPERSLPRQELQAKLGLKDPNLTRVLTMLSSSGLLERSARGKEAVFSLTKDGAEHAQSLPHGSLVSGHKNEAEEHLIEEWTSRTRTTTITRTHTWKIAMTTAHSPPRRSTELLKARVQRREKSDDRRYRDEARIRENSHE